jgi:hypothetical protein
MKNEVFLKKNFLKKAFLYLKIIKKASKTLLFLSGLFTIRIRRTKRIV